MKRREAVFRALMVLLTVAVALGAAELVLRLYFGSGLTADELRARLEESRDAELDDSGGRFSLFGLVQASTVQDMVYELKPGLEGTFRGEPIRINAFGLRDDEIALAKAEGTVRIVGLGDSTMFGWGVPQGAAYLDHLEQHLNRDAPAGRRFEVLNCAVPGYNTTMEVAAYEHKCRRFDPDLVVIEFVGNDFDYPHLMRRPDATATGEPGLYLAAFVRGLLGAGTHTEDTDLLRHDLRGQPSEVRRESRRQYRHMVGEKAFRQAVSHLAELTRADGIPVVLMTLSESGEQRQRVAAVAREHGFDVVTTGRRHLRYLEDHGLEPSDKAWRRTFQVPKDGHPNVLGHRLVGEVLYEALRARFALLSPSF